MFNKTYTVKQIKLSTNSNIHREYELWKKTEDFTKWRKKQFLRQGGLCWYCQDYLPYTRINVEHIIPRSKGGTNRKSNLVLACSNCNKNKGSSLVPLKVVKQNRVATIKQRGKYLKNRRWFEQTYGQYTDNGFRELMNNLRED